MSRCDAANPFFLAVITPALFQPYPSAPDEWMFAALMRADGTLKSTMEKHYDTFITEQDIAAIAGAGLNWVRVPMPFWSISESKDPTLREILIKRLAAAVPASNTFNKTAGVDRYVRHAGTFSGPEPPGNSKRTENKATVQAVATW
ncbi:hypothetical protein B0H10DRAFT_2241382 [Mycena sp. CBHHK59/15]|nr:hypothetical protein B0H10DRAFT_2241382 [Mycena sp. CBHHK59/15]